MLSKSEIAYNKVTDLALSKIKSTFDGNIKDKI